MPHEVERIYRAHACIEVGPRLMPGRRAPAYGRGLAVL